MASSKNSDDSKKIMDVAHPNTSAAESSGKSIIVNNRQLMKDPMMVDDKKSDKVEIKISQGSSKNALEPLTAPELPILDMNIKKELKKSEEKLAPPLSEFDPTDTKAEEEKPDEEAEKVDKEAEDKPKEEAEPEEKSEEKEEEPAPEEKPEAKKEDDEPKEDTKAEEKEKPAEDKPETKDDSESKDSDSDEEVKTDDSSPEDIEAKEMAKQAEHDAAIDKLAESKEYFLPINSVEKRRSKRFVSLGVLLSLVLIVAWVDIALDAGLINLSSNIPHTHFFSSSSTADSTLPATTTTSTTTPKTVPLTKDQSLAVTQIKAIQTLLESYFATNNYYPSDLTPAPLVNQTGANGATTSEFTPPTGTKFVYTVYPSNCSTKSKNCQHYIIKAETTGGKVLDSLHSVN